jgi:hypothetical protein
VQNVRNVVCRGLRRDINKDPGKIGTTYGCWKMQARGCEFLARGFKGHYWNAECDAEQRSEGAPQ